MLDLKLFTTLHSCSGSYQCCVKGAYKMQISAPNMVAAFSNKTLVPSFVPHNLKMCVCECNIYDSAQVSWRSLEQIKITWS